MKVETNGWTFNCRVDGEQGPWVLLSHGLATDLTMWDELADALKSPADPMAQAIDGAANAITAAICKTTNSQPAAVCTAPGVIAAAKTLGHG